MKLLRFATVGVVVVGVAACAFAAARLVGWIPPGKLPPYPAWAGWHLASATLFAGLALLQLWPRLRARRPALHRAVGRVAVVVGGVMAVSGIALVYTAPGRPVSELIFMSTFFVGYFVCLGLGVRGAVARDIAAHEAWMSRMFATALTPVTQRLVFPPLAAAIGIDGLETFWQLFTSAAWLAWGLNMSVCEAWLRRQTAPRLRRAAPG
jgi:uncharacterized membrane protein